MSMKRRKARESAMQFLYAQETQSLALSAEDFLRGQGAQTTEQIDTEYFLQLLEKVNGHNQEIDSLIEMNSDNWKLSRMPRVDRNILRVATAEILYSKEISPNIAIDEAIEIAKRFGTEASASFINGILDPIAKKRSAL